MATFDAKNIHLASDASDISRVQHSTIASIRRFFTEDLQRDDIVVGQPLALVDETEVFWLLTFIERRFGVALHDDDVVAANFTNIDRIASVVDSKRLLRRDVYERESNSETFAQPLADRFDSVDDARLAS